MWRSYAETQRGQGRLPEESCLPSRKWQEKQPFMEKVQQRLGDNRKADRISRQLR